jgi:hypothetical protein
MFSGWMMQIEDVALYRCLALEVRVLILLDMYRPMIASHWRTPCSMLSPLFLYQDLYSTASSFPLIHLENCDFIECWNRTASACDAIKPQKLKLHLDTGCENLLKHLVFFMNCTIGFVEPKYVPVYHMHLIEVTFFSPGRNNSFWSFPHPSSRTSTNLKWVNNEKTTWTQAVHKSIHPSHLLFIYANY